MGSAILISEHIAILSTPNKTVWWCSLFSCYWLSSDLSLSYNCQNCWLPQLINNLRLQELISWWQCQGVEGFKSLCVCHPFYLVYLLPSSVPVGSSVHVQLRTEISLIITVRPTPPHPTPGKYIWATSTPPRRLKFGTETLFNKTRSTS